MWSGTCTPVSLCRTCRLHTHSFLAICCTLVSLWLIPFWFNTSHTTLVSAWLQLCWLSQCHMAIVLHLLATWVLSTTTPPASMLPPWLAKLTGFSSRVTWRHFISECSWIFLTQFPMSCLYSRAPFIQCKAKVLSSQQWSSPIRYPFGASLVFVIVGDKRSLQPILGQQHSIN